MSTAICHENKPLKLTYIFELTIKRLKIFDRITFAESMSLSTVVLIESSIKQVFNQMFGSQSGLSTPTVIDNSIWRNLFVTNLLSRITQQIYHIRLK